MEQKAKMVKHMDKRKKDLIFYSCVVALPFIHYLIFYIGVNFNSILMAFQKIDVYGNTTMTGFSNFKRVFTELTQTEALVQAFGNSMLAYGIGLIIGMPVALLFSYYIAKKRFGHKLFSVVLFLPSIIPSFCVTMIYRRVVDSSLPYLLADLGFQIEGLMTNSSTAFGTVIFYSLWVSFGGNVLLYIGAMRGISDAIVEAAELDGATGFKEFYHISIPMIWPTIVTFLVVGLAGIFTADLGLFNFYSETAPSSMQTYGYYLYASVVKANGSLEDYPYFSALGLTFTVIVAPIVFIVKRALEKYGPSKE